MERLAIYSELPSLMAMQSRCSVDADVDYIKYIKRQFREDILMVFLTLIMKISASQESANGREWDIALTSE